MARCLKQVTYLSGPALVFDDATPVSGCNTLVISAVEYQDLSHGWIATKEEAEAIAAPLILLFAIVAGIKAIKSALNTYNAPSDEKH